MNEPREQRATNIRFAPEELERLRRRAIRAGVSVQAYVHDVVMRDVDELEQRFLAAADRVVAATAEAFGPADAARQAEQDILRDRERQAAEELARSDPEATTA